MNDAVATNEADRRPPDSGRDRGGLHHYNRWQGRLRERSWVSLTICRAAIRQKLGNTRIQMMVMMGVLGFTGAYCMLFWVIAALEVVVGTDQAQQFYGIVQTFLKIDLHGVAQLGEYRELLWRTAYMMVFKVQLFYVLILVSLVGPSLVSNDIKVRALPIYFSKPITPATYLFGKWLAVATFIGSITLLPNILSLILGTVMIGGPGGWGPLFGLGFDLLWAGLATCLVGGMIVLACSSITADYRMATVAWLAVCLLLQVAQSIVNENVPAASTKGWLGCMSVGNNLMALTDWLMGVAASWRDTKLPEQAFNNALVRPVAIFNVGVVLAAWVAGAAVLSYRRVVRFSRSAANL